MIQYDNCIHAKINNEKNILIKHCGRIFLQYIAI